MTRSELKKLLGKTLDIDEVGDDFDFSQCQEFDSLGVMSLVAMISSKFGKTIPSQQLVTLTTLDSLIALIGEDKIQHD